MALAYIEAFLYSTGSASSMNTCNTANADEGAASPGDATLAATVVYSDAIAEWASTWTAAGTGTYTITHAAPTTRDGLPTVTVANDTTNFDLTFTKNAGAVIGFTSGPWTGAASYTSDAHSLGRFDLLRADCAILEDDSEVQLDEFRHGRHEVFVFGNHSLWSAQVTMFDGIAESFLESYCANGKVRIYQDGDNSSPYSINNLSGYVDGYIVAIEQLDTHGFNEDVVTFDLTVAVSDT